MHITSVISGFVKGPEQHSFVQDCDFEQLYFNSIEIKKLRCLGGSSYKKKKNLSI